MLLNHFLNHSYFYYFLIGGSYSASSYTFSNNLQSIPYKYEL